MRDRWKRNVAGANITSPLVRMLAPATFAVQQLIGEETNRICHEIRGPWTSSQGSTTPISIGHWTAIVILNVQYTSMYYSKQALFLSAQVNSILFHFLSEAGFGILLFWSFAGDAGMSWLQLCSCLKKNLCTYFSPLVLANAVTYSVSALRTQWLFYELFWPVLWW